MASYHDTIQGSKTPEAAFDYLADFTSTLDWDPSVDRAERLDDGPVGPGSKFKIVTRFAGRDVELVYEIVEYDHPRRVVLRGENKTTVSIDTIEVAPDGAGCTVTYDAQLELAGPLKLADPLVHLIFQRLGAKAAAGLRTHLSN